MSDHSYRRTSPTTRRARSTARTVLRVLPLAAALLMAQHALAQSGSDDDADSRKEKAAKTLDKVKVTGTAATKEVTLGRMPATLRQTPQTVTVIDAARIEEQNLQTLDDVLAQTPGVVMEARTTDENYYYIRGQQVESFQYDGLVMSNTPWLTANPNMDMFDQIEVLRGANGVLNGVNGFGAINMLRKRPKNDFALTADLSYGRWDAKNVSVDVTGPLSPDGRVRGRAVASASDRDFFYDVGHKQTELFYGIVEFDISDDTLLTVSAHKQDVDSTPIVFGMPRYSDGQSLGLSRSTYLNTAWSRFFVHESDAYLSLEKKWDNGWKGRLALNHQQADSHYKYGYVWGAVDPDTLEGANVYGTFYNFDAKQDIVDLTANGEITLFGREHQLMVGGNWIRAQDSYQYASLDSIIQPADVFNWDPYAIPEPADPSSYSYYSPDYWTYEQSGIFVSSRFNLSDRLHLLASARMSWWEMKGSELSADDPDYVYSAGFKVTRKVTPQFGLIWDFAEHWSAYASYADIFTPQSSRTYSGALLDPLLGANYEIGIKGELFDGRLNAAITAFRVEETNRAEVDLEHSITSGASQQYYYVANGETRSQGVELELGGSPVDGWTISGGYTYNTTELTKANEDQGRPYATYIPRHMFRAWTNYVLPVDGGRWSVGGGVNVQSKVSRPVEWGGPYMTQGGYALLNLRAGYKVNDNLSLAVNVNNLTDKTYYSRVNETPNTFNFYGEPRNVTFSVRAKFF